MEIIYYEDVELHKKNVLGEHYADKNEMIEFARKWDAMPFHIDEDLAKSYPPGGLTASGLYTLSVTRRLHTMNEKPRLAEVAGLGLEQVKILNPVRPGDKLVVTEEHIDKRESRTNPDRGIIRTLVEVNNQNNELCLSTVSVGLVAKRPA